MATLFDTHQAAARIGLARATLAKLRVVGGGPPFLKLGAKVLYDGGDLDSWLHARRRVSTSDHTTQTALSAGWPHK